jgi:hypothetical protein
VPESYGVKWDSESKLLCIEDKLRVEWSETNNERENNAVTPIVIELFLSANNK